MGKFVDLKGMVFTRLTVLERSYEKKSDKQTFWKCQCHCGNVTTVNSRHLKAGNIKSCGCLNLEINSIRMKGNNYGFKHGLYEHPLRFIRKSMIHRCYNSNNRFYKNYGGRGIAVCEQWKNSLEDFVSWSIEKGWVKGLSIDRIDNDLNYTPENCQWITISENSRKKRKSRTRCKEKPC